VISDRHPIAQAPRPSDSPVRHHLRHRVRYLFMPLTLFDTKGIPATRRERIEAAVVAGGRHVATPHEAWIGSDPFRNGLHVLITGPHGFQRTVSFALDEVPASITQRVQETSDAAERLYTIIHQTVTAY
jgi:hypothetical protein